MSNRFKALGNFVYENGDRIGCTVEEANVDLAKKLNAYQMRVERLKAEVERLRASSFVTAVPGGHYEAQRRRIEALREAGDGLWYCLRHKGAVSPEERNDYIVEWTEAQDGIK